MSPFSKCTLLLVFLGCFNILSAAVNADESTFSSGSRNEQPTKQPPKYKTNLREKLGLRPGDVITEINGVPVSSPEEVKSELDSAKKKDAFVLKIRRAGKILTLQYDFN